MSNFVHLHTHSHYSLLDGLPKIDQLLDRAKELGMDAMALTDHGVLYGAIEFYTKAKEKGIKPIIGCEIYLARRGMEDRTPKIDTKPYHLTLLAKDKEGYLNLIKIVTAAHLEGYYYKPRIDKEFLAKHSTGLIALSGCFFGEIPVMITAGNFEGAKKVALEYQKMFAGDFYLELQDHPKIEGQKEINEKLIKIFKEINIPVVATADIHYILPEDKDPHDILLKVQTSQFDEERKLEMKAADLWVKSPEEMEKSFKKIPEALENTIKISKICNLELDLGVNLLPHFEVPKNETSNSYLEKLSKEGLKKKYGKGITDEINKRLKYELSVIKKTGFAPYFLIVADLVNWAKNKGIIVGPGRGSAAGSLVSYSLGITDIDPIKYNLIFERFLNPERIAMPDIDLDFQDDRRGEVINYLVEKYGQDYVAQIITFGTMAARAAVRDTGRALGMSYPEVDRVAKLVSFNLPLTQSIKTTSELKKIYNEDREVKKLLDLACRLEGVARHASTRAAGVVISKEPLVNYTPLQKAVKGETSVVTQYSMYDVEKIGLLKMDLLGLANLTILKETLEIIEAVYGKKIDLKKISVRDEKTYKLLSKGETIGVFQLESEGMRKYLKELKPTVFEDIISMVALYRPGPVESIPEFIAGKHGLKKEITYLDPKLKSILEKTYGVIVTQDQVLEIARKFAGLTYSEADILRKAVGKKIPKLLREQKEKFIKGAVKNGAKKEIAEKVWDFIEPFAKYGFNRAHAACYSLIAYWTAYLKAHFPSAFMAALMTSEQDDIDKISRDVSECKRLGIEVLPPDVNESFSGFAVVPQTGNIRFGLAAIKNVGSGIIKAIVSERKKAGKFKSLEDFIRRIPYLEINRKVLEALIKSGAMDTFGKREEMLAGIDQILTYSQKIQKNLVNGQIDLFAQSGNSSVASLILPKVEEIDKQQKLAWEKELLGIYVSSHPIADFEDYLRKNTVACGDLKDEKIGQRVKIGGIITNLHKIITKSGQPMLFVGIEDTTGSIEALVFPKVLEKYPDFWLRDKIILIDGRISVNKDGEIKVICEEVEELDSGRIAKSQVSQDIIQNQSKKVVIEMPGDSDINFFKKVQGILEQNKGNDTVFIKIDSKKIKLPFGVGFSKDLESKLIQILGEGSVVEL